jgi:hypothetical protein
MVGIKVGGGGISIVGIESSGHTLVSSEVALGFARLVLRDNCGDEALETQSPLTIEAEADEWIVRGSAPHAVGPKYPIDPDEKGRFEIRIAQFDGQIRRLVFNISVPEAAEFARKRREERSATESDAARDHPSPSQISTADKKAD